MPPYPISTLTEPDLEQAVDLACLCFKEEWRQFAYDSFRASFFTDYPYPPKSFVAKDGERVIGILQSVEGDIHPNTRAFAWLGVHPDVQGQGIAKALLAHAEQDAITHFFEGEAGTFILSAAYDPDYYRSLGYDGALMMHDGVPYMAKKYRPE